MQAKKKKTLIREILPPAQPAPKSSAMLPKCSLVMEKVDDKQRLSVSFAVNLWKVTEWFYGFSTYNNDKTYRDHHGPGWSVTAHYQCSNHSSGYTSSSYYYTSYWWPHHLILLLVLQCSDTHNRFLEWMIRLVVDAWARWKITRDT